MSMGRWAVPARWSPRDLVVRRATMQDAALLLAWRNDPETRRLSFETALVAESGHAVWLDHVSKDVTRQLVIVEVADGPVGTYRLDGLGGDEVEISVTVAPERRGQGLATPIILCGAVNAIASGAMFVRAHVRLDNTRSRRAFLRAGFWLCGHESGAKTVFHASVEEIAGQLCARCEAHVPHHTNAGGSIGGSDRHSVYDLHAVEDTSGVGLAECDAGDMLLAWERARASQCS